MRGLDYFFALLSLLSLVLALLGLTMNQATANFIKGLFNGLNDATAYRLGLWINGLVAAALGALLGGGINTVGQFFFSPGPMRWVEVGVWAKAATGPAVVGYFTASPLKQVFAPDSVTVQQTTVTTPTTQTERTVVIAQQNNEEPQT